MESLITPEKYSVVYETENVFDVYEQAISGVWLDLLRTNWAIPEYLQEMNQAEYHLDDNAG